MEINSTHGEFHVRMGGDEKLKNYFAWPNRLTFVFIMICLFFRAELLSSHVSLQVGFVRWHLIQS